MIILTLGPIHDVNRPLSQNEVKNFKNKLYKTVFLISVLSILFFFFKKIKILKIFMIAELFESLVLILGLIKNEKE